MNDLEAYAPAGVPLVEPIVNKENIKIGHSTTLLFFIGFLCLTAGGLVVVSIIEYGVVPRYVNADSVESTINNESFRQGVEYTIATITERVVACDPLPVTYMDINYTLVALECLDLTKLEVK